ncbi:hypothetical protein [Aquipuribacter hungaricus]|uniref:PH domain-containing protein n=1 Tax=Aquipuribacter hungaricus TaxID=545624 RepID=A0ABV7WEN0_9MICO
MTAVTARWARRLGRLAVTALRWEAAGWASAARVVARRPKLGPGGTAVPYVGGLRTVLVVLVGLSAVEIVVLDLVLQPWPTVRFPVLVLGVWGLLFMLGVTAGLVVHPHVVGPDGVRVRSGPLVEVVVPWGAVDRVVVRRHAFDSGASVQVDDGTEDGAVVSFPVQGTTAAEVLLDRPLTLALPKGAVAARAVRFHCDDTTVLMAAVRTHLRAFEQRG